MKKDEEMTNKSTGTLQYKENEDPWTMQYQRMVDEVCKNEKEEKAVEYIRSGASLYASRNESGLTEAEFDDLYERLSAWETIHMTTGKGKVIRTDHLDLKQEKR